MGLLDLLMGRSQPAQEQPSPLAQLISGEALRASTNQTLMPAPDPIRDMVSQRRASPDPLSLAIGLIGGPRAMPMRSLPMNESARIGRAQSQGFTRDVYRGEGAPIAGQEFKTGHPGRYDPGFLGGDAIYSTNRPNLANDYAMLKAYKEMPGAEAPNVMPLKLKMENPVTITAEEKQAIAKMDRFDRDDWLRDKVYGKGHDGVVVNYGNNYEEYAAPANQYRSRFAVFDPKNASGGGLLGSILGALMMGGNDQAQAAP